MTRRADVRRRARDEAHARVWREVIDPPAPPAVTTYPKRPPTHEALGYRNVAEERRSAQSLAALGYRNYQEQRLHAFECECDTCLEPYAERIDRERDADYLEIIDGAGNVVRRVRTNW